MCVCVCDQSDVVHQSVYELVHSEDREELQRQLTWSSQLAGDSGLTLMDALRTDNSLLLERSFTVRFRCLLDNTSGFLVRSFFLSQHAPPTCRYIGCQMVSFSFQNDNEYRSTQLL